MFKKISLFVAIALVSGCAVSAHNETSEKTDSVSVPENKVVKVENAKFENSKPATAIKTSIEITEGSPADVVRTFYKDLHDKKFVEALAMTNMSKTVEGLTPEELNDLSPYFAALANQTPEEVAIKGEQISGVLASVFVNIPDEDTKNPFSTITLRKESAGWVILLADAQAEADAKRKGKSYLFGLMIDVHESETENMMSRIIQAQALNYGSVGTFGEMSELVQKGFLPQDIQTSDSTGYNFKIVISADKMKYYATAEPAKYGKTGKLSFFLEFDGKNSKLKKEDNKGLPIKK
jgi:hypothetical protein